MPQPAVLTNTHAGEPLGQPRLVQVPSEAIPRAAKAIDSSDANHHLQRLYTGRYIHIHMYIHFLHTYTYIYLHIYIYTYHIYLHIYIHRIHMCHMYTIYIDMPIFPTSHA